MGLRNFGKGIVIRKLLSEVPMIGNALKWLTDPAAIGRKRTIAAIAAVLAGMMRGAESALRAACDAADFVGAVCSFEPGYVAGFLDGFAKWLNAVVVPGADAVTLIMGLWGLWAARGKKAVVVTSMLILTLVLPGAARAQDQADPVPSPSPAVEINLYAGAMQFAERGQPDKRDFVYRLTVNLPAPSGVTLFARADYTRTQDGGDLLDVKTFRSVEAFAGGRKDIAPNLSALAYSGVSWNRDSSFEPADPRLWTAAAGLRYSVPGRGYVLASAGHHGPVGGAAFLGSIVYEINSGASWFGDVAIPLDASRFAARPYTIKAGISARLKGWKF